MPEESEKDKNGALKEKTALEEKRMRNEFHCPSCLMSLSARQKTCPNCGKPNPYYVEGLSPERLTPESGLHDSDVTIGTCEFCDSEVYSDEQFCTHCGAPNPKYVVHPGSRTATRTKNGYENASTGRCPYCGGTIRSNERYCTKCGSPNSHYIEDTARVIIHPKTIDELKEYCAERDMPLLRMRFFIGEDYQGAQAFGIYKDEGLDRYIVYKNKSDGSRAVRYSGPDEAYAVNEIYQKLLEECRKRGINPDHSLNETYATTTNQYEPRSYQYKANTSKNSSKKTGSRIFKTIVLIVIIVIVARIFLAGVGSCLAGNAFWSSGSSGSGSGSSWSSGSSGSGSGSSWDWGSDSGSSSWDSDSGSSSWDSWDSSDTSWDSDW